VTELLSVTDLSVSFATDDGVVRAVRDVSFDVGPGEVLGVVGESGCGKSVTAAALMGLLPRTATVAGSIRFRGRELVGLPGRQLRALRGSEIAMIFQDPMSALNPVHTVGAQLAEAYRAHHDVSRRVARSRAVEALELVGIPQPARRADQFPHEFSGGMRQRVVIAMAVINDPRLLIADEPTTALDVTVQAQILETLQAVRERTGAAIMMITHDLGVVAGLAGRVQVMYGRGVRRPADALHPRPARFGAASRAGRPAVDARPRRAAVAATPAPRVHVRPAVPAGRRGLPGGGAGAA
jgi:peptide/nickel transport system ATP-binding protein